MKEAWQSLDVDNGGTLWHAAKEVARYDADTEQRQKRIGWEIFARETGPVSYEEVVAWGRPRRRHGCACRRQRRSESGAST